MMLTRYAIIHTEESLDWLTENTKRSNANFGPIGLKNFGNLKIHFKTDNVKVITNPKSPKLNRVFTVSIEGEDPEILNRDDFIKKYCKPYTLIFNEERTFVYGTEVMLKEFMEVFSTRFPEVEFEKADDWYVIDSNRNRAEQRWCEIMEKKNKDK